MKEVIQQIALLHPVAQVATIITIGTVVCIVIVAISRGLRD